MLASFSPACRFRAAATTFRLLATAVVAAALLAVAGTASASAYPAPAAVTGDGNTHDPSMVIRPFDPKYVVVSTNDVARTSPDGLGFGPIGHPLNLAPQWWLTYNAGGHSWAPDASFHNGRYWMYYAVSSFGSQNSAIGLATSATADPGSWTDEGIVFSSAAGKSYNAIDPSLLVDASGRWWLTFGSFWGGIYQLELNPTTGKPLSSSPTLIHLAQRPVANDPIEGPHVVRHGAYYYLFASFDYCCQGVNSTYSIRVGRSRYPNGPYVDASGVKMLNGGGTIVLASHDRVIGPGGQSVVHDDARGQDLLVYHYYDGQLNGLPRLGINALGWTPGGWPYVI
jgi:arabinan endo-1,5-alpha-L-arabinosidase